MDRNTTSFEEALIEYLAPNGLLSEKLGLSKFERLEDGDRFEWFKRFYKELSFLSKYDFSESIWEFMLKRSKNRKIREISKRIIKKEYPLKGSE